jgi:hypothetical protein
MRNNLRKISLYIISMTANLSSLCATLYSNWEIRKRLTDYSELTFFTSNSNNLLKNKIKCVSLFQITLYEEGAHSKTASIKTPSYEIQKTQFVSGNTPETKTASFKTAKIHNSYIQNAQCQKAQFFCIPTSF